MSAIAGGEPKEAQVAHARRSGGNRLVVDEFLRRGFNAQLADRGTKEHDVLVDQFGSPPKPVHVRTVNVSPWYVRRSHFAEAAADQVTVYVLLSIDKERYCARFFVTRNGDMESRSVSRRIGENLDSLMSKPWSNTRTTGIFWKPSKFETRHAVARADANALTEILSKLRRKQVDLVAVLTF